MRAQAKPEQRHELADYFVQHVSRLRSGVQLYTVLGSGCPRYSDADTFFSTDGKIESEADSPPNSPTMKRPRPENTCRKRGRPVPPAPLGQLDESEESESEPADVETDTTFCNIPFGHGTNCKCSDAHHFSVLELKQVRDVRHHAAPAPRRTKTLPRQEYSPQECFRRMPQLVRYVAFGQSTLYLRWCSVLLSDNLSYLYKIGSRRPKRWQKLVPLVRSNVSPSRTAMKEVYLGIS